MLACTLSCAKTPRCLTNSPRLANTDIVPNSNYSWTATTTLNTARAVLNSKRSGSRGESPKPGSRATGEYDSGLRTTNRRAPILTFFASIEYRSSSNRSIGFTDRGFEFDSAPFDLKHSERPVVRAHCLEISHYHISQSGGSILALWFAVFAEENSNPGAGNGRANHEFIVLPFGSFVPFICVVDDKGLRGVVQGRIPLFRPLPD